jgi:hypothetical protein
MEIKTFTVYLHGCDDTTSFDMDLTKEELKLIVKLQMLSQEKSRYACQPVLEVELK